MGARPLLNLMIYVKLHKLKNPRSHQRDSDPNVFKNQLEHLHHWKRFLAYVLYLPYSLPFLQNYYH